MLTMTLHFIAIYHLILSTDFSQQIPKDVDRQLPQGINPLYVSTLDISRWKGLFGERTGVYNDMERFSCMKIRVFLVSVSSRLKPHSTACFQIRKAILVSASYIQSGFRVHRKQTGIKRICSLSFRLARVQVLRNESYHEKNLG